MNCSILAVGTELLMGQTLNSNASFLSQELNKLGYNVLYHFTVGDNPIRLEKIFNICLEISDIIITTGGLGPTQDDLTKETISNCLARKLIIHEETLKKIKDFFEKINKKMSKNNIKQAYIPENCIVLENIIGTAPGLIVEHKNKIIICLPGPPKEMTDMFLNKVVPYLSKNSKDLIVSKIIKFVGLGESNLEIALEDIISRQTNPTLATYANDGDLSLRITAKGKSNKIINELINPVVLEIKRRLDDYIYSYNNESLEEVVGKALIKNNLSISLAESCTGGLLSARLTSVPGISKVLDRTIVTYSNLSKIQELGVDENIIKRYGAVSEETALAMVKGLKKITDSDICLSITGIAGPTGSTSEKPIGLVYIAIQSKNTIFCNKYVLHGDRNKIRNYAVINALDLIRKSITNKNNN